MSKAKKTPWFDGDVKPMRVGVYERDDSATWLGDGSEAFSFWDGHYWMALSLDIDSANSRNYPSQFQLLPWRGLARRPR